MHHRQIVTPAHCGPNCAFALQLGNYTGYCKPRSRLIHAKGSAAGLSLPHCPQMTHKLKNSKTLSVDLDEAFGFDAANQQHFCPFFLPFFFFFFFFVHLGAGYS
ncbi:hypothetical protein BDW68DRAFT_167903 [Aspergillus falconensis]